VAIDRAVLLPTELAVNPAALPGPESANPAVGIPESPAQREYHVNTQEV